jgi:hypothetical protein
MGLEMRAFKDIDLNDSFFDSLKADYKEFPYWFAKKSAGGDDAYIFLNDTGSLDGFLYLKVEDGALDDVVPALPPRHRLKVGTMKINPHGTRLGERFIKKIFDHALAKNVEEIYVTVFDHHSKLINMFAEYGFQALASKTTANGTEQVLVRNIHAPFEGITTSYPLVKIGNRTIFQVAIEPKWHTKLFPDSILKNESASIVEDVSHTNSIHKVYLAGMHGMEKLRRGDVILIYRKSDGAGPARYRSVATSVCVMEEYRSLGSFADKESFLAYCRPYSVFTGAELDYLWQVKKYHHVIRFTYNFALKKRVTRGDMIDLAGVSESAYAGFLELTHDQFKKILQLGEADESLVIN